MQIGLVYDALKIKIRMLLVIQPMDVFAYDLKILKMIVNSSHHMMESISN